MAVYGLQEDFINTLLNEYFSNIKSELDKSEYYLGLGLTQQGASINMEGFDEVFGGKPLANYKRARIIFGRADNGSIQNENEIIFQTASEDWTEVNRKIEMVGIFNTLEENNTKPLIVLQLPYLETILKGETLLLAPGAIKLSLSDI